MVLGIGSLLLPVWVSHTPDTLPVSLSILIRDAVEEMGVSTIALLFGSGVLIGWFWSRPVSLLCAVTTVAWLPVVSMIDMMTDATSHNLWPFEFILYGVLSLVPLGGSLLGAQLAKRRLKRTRIVGL